MVTLKEAASAEAIVSCVSLSPEHQGGCPTCLGASAPFWVSTPGNQAQPLPPVQAWGPAQLLVLGLFPVCEKGGLLVLPLDSTLLWVGTSFGFSGPQPFPGPQPLPSHLAGPGRRCLIKEAQQRLGHLPGLWWPMRGGFVLFQHVAQTCGALRLSVTFWALEQDKRHPIWVF